MTSNCITAHLPPVERHMVNAMIARLNDVLRTNQIAVADGTYSPELVDALLKHIDEARKRARPQHEAITLLEEYRSLLQSGDMGSATAEEIQRINVAIARLEGLRS